MNINRTIHFWVPNLFEFKGGIQTYLLDALSTLEKCFLRYQFHVIDKLDKAKPEDWDFSDNFTFTFHGVHPSYLITPAFTLQLITQAIVNRPQLILCGQVNFSPVAYWLNQWLGIPYWVFIYGIDVWNLKEPRKIKALHHADKIISISGYTRDRLIAEQNIPSSKFALLPVTFDARRFSIAPKPDGLLQRYGLTREQPVILTVARLDETEQYKGYDSLLQALPTILRHLPTVHYVLVGKGRDRLRIEALVDQLELRDHVTLTGFVPDEELAAHYHLCDVFAMPSKKEGFGIVYLEALACGKPTLGGNQDGALDALCHGQLGALVDPDDTQAIAQTLVEILQGDYPNPLMYQPEQLRQKVIDTYGVEKFQNILQRYIEQFDRENN